jgi:hypothetical protein
MNSAIHSCSLLREVICLEESSPEIPKRVGTFQDDGKRSSAFASKSGDHPCQSVHYLN